MVTIRDFVYAIVIFVGIYLAIFLSWILIPATVFMFVLYVVRQFREFEEEPS